MTALQIYTIAHVVISLIAILTGLVVTYGLMQSKRLDQLTVVFLVTTILTSVTGFPFFLFAGFLPKFGPTPGVIFAFLSLILLTAAVYARYVGKLEGVWRPIYINTAIFALYLNVVVLVVQSFQKIPALHALETRSALASSTVQLVCLLAFAYAGFNATTKFERTGK